MLKKKVSKARGVHHRLDGYILVRIGVIPRSAKGAGHKLQHRIVMEEKLGRNLKRNEIIHHKNGNRSDNRVSNLQVMSQAEHAKLDYVKRKKDKLGRLL